MLKDIFQVYFNRLIDLSSGNRSVFLPKIINSQMIDLKDFHFLNNHPAFFYITELVGRKRNVPLIQVLDSRDKNVNQLSVRLKRLHQNDRFAEEETGEKTLFVGWPFVEGKLINDQLIRCPLIFFPVSIVHEDNTWYLRKAIGEAPFINPTFLLAYSQAQGRPFDKEWLEQSLEDFSKDPIGFRTDLYHYLKNKVELNFGREIYQDKLEIFPEQSRAYFEESFKTGILKIQPYAVLGQFSQKSSSLMDDYKRLITESDHQTLEDLLSARFDHETGEEKRPQENNLYNTFPMDASQEEVLKFVKQGMSCVVQGPPGTGKSQLICNLISDFISRGKKVLVVSQKRAALDVVFERVSAQGMGNFTALVHDYRSDRKELYKKIAHQISSLESYQALNRSLDAIQLERSFSQLSRQIEKDSDFFDEYKEALYDDKECGAPVKELYLTSSMNDEITDLTQYYRYFRLDDLDAFLHDFSAYQTYYKRYEEPSSFWLHRVDFAAMGPQAVSNIKAIFEEIASVKYQTQKDLGDLLADTFEYPIIYESFEHREKLQELAKMIDSPDIFEKFKALMGYDKSVFDRLWLENKIEMIGRLFSGAGIEWSTPDEEVEPMLEKTIHASDQMDSWIGKIMLRFDSRKYGDVVALLETNGLKKTKEGLGILAQKLENRMNLSHQYTLLSQKSWIKLPSKPFDLAEFVEVTNVLTAAVRSRFIMTDLGVLSTYIFKAKLSYGHFHNLLAEMIRITAWMADHFPSWQKYLTEIQIKHLLSTADEEKLIPVKIRLAKDIDDLVRYDGLKKKMNEVERKVVEKLIDEFPDKEFEELKQIFLSSLKLSWVGHLEAKYPVLKEIHDSQIKQRIQDFGNAVEEKLKVARFIVEMRLREDVCKNLEYNRLNNMITYRELNHQVLKKRQVWAIKKLVEEFDEEVFRLMPCWLASPETASALFPLRPCFDLVIFDEASQCYFERGLPIMLRGRQVVVAGDSNQLQPYDLYQARVQTEEEGMELEIDSLLDMASKYFPSHSLTTHYRSQTLPLIHFSNLHFYDNRLYMLPDREVLNSGYIPIRLIKTDGVWENQINKEEAGEVIRQLKKIWEAHPKDTVGIITFNYFQMVLVNELIDGEFGDSGLDRVRVKNIENVQGDEYDRVIFSIGYAPNPQGKFTANFGLLSRKGGENRLNVAVTRARKEIVLITGLGPGNFKEHHLTNPGVRVLKDYIQYAKEVQEGNMPDRLPFTHPDYHETWSLKNRLINTYGNHEVVENDYDKIMDLEVQENGNATAAILTDDQRFFAALSAKEAFVYHPQMLTLKNWSILFLFSRQYWIDKEDLLQTKLKLKSTEKDGEATT
ncbi:AAA domain-containing protein [Negadavirga shengliensis]|uniref:AAA domain-containing protein n=1 Tax=Negadavirga shengliensis TaxID=1389218 RepID=A0ABV9T8S4_9BACT